MSENEYVLILWLCVERANQVFDKLAAFFLIKNQEFFIQVTDDICSPHAVPYDAIIDFLKKYGNKYWK